ncbi:MAG TPA: hypothetical protein VLA24_17870 [Pseudomonadales bacterium]|nr:hypothetical protein [Pseudomonadales bacterium]
MAIDYRELGSTGLKRNGGIVYEEFLPELRGARWLRKVKEMSEQDPIVTAELLAIEMLLRQVDQEIEPSEDDTGQAEFVESCFGDMSVTWEDTLSEILTMLPYGHAYMEVTYKRRGGNVSDPKRKSRYDDNMISWRKWSLRSQDSLFKWEFDASGGVQGMWQSIDGKGPVLIPIEKALLFRTSTRKGNPEGKSVLRGAYRPYYFKKNLENIEGIGVERDLAGLPVAYAPPEIMSSGASADQQALYAEIKNIVSNIRRDEQEGVVWPLAYDANNNPLFKLELLSAPGSRQFDIGAIIQRYNTQIAMTTLADFITLGHENVGSYSLSATKDSLFKTALEAWLDSIAAVVNTHAIPRLLKLNGMATAQAPKMKFSGIGKVDLADIIAFISAATSAGMQLFPSMELENELRSQLRFPLLTDEEANDRNQPEIVPPSTTQPQDDDEAMALAARYVVGRGW